MANCTTYQVSVASHFLSLYGPASINFFTFLLPYLDSLPADLKDTIGFTLGHISTLSIVGGAMLVVAVIVLLLQFPGKCFSSPTESYWVWAIRATRIFLVLIGYVVSLIAAVGLYHVYEMHSIIIDPLNGLQQVLSEKYKLTVQLGYLINITAQSFGIPVPAEYQIVFQYEKDLGNFYQSFYLTEQLLILMSDYAHLLLAAGFGLIIVICVLCALFSLTKHKYLPAGTIILILLTTFVIWIISSITGAISLILAKECNRGLDSFTHQYVASQSSNSTCVYSLLNHYLFCDPWVNTTTTTSLSATSTSCDPYSQMYAFINHILSVIGENYPAQRALLLKANSTITQLDSCVDTQGVYWDSKKNLCWDINNASMQITLLFFVQAPILLVLLIYILFAWHRFNIHEIAYTKTSSSQVAAGGDRQQKGATHDGDVTDRTEELADLGPPEESIEDIFTNNVNTPPNSSTTRTWGKGFEDDRTDENSMSETTKLLQDKPMKKKKTCCGVEGELNTKVLKKMVMKNVRTVIFTASNFFIVLLMLLVWLGIVNTDFETPYSAYLC